MKIRYCLRCNKYPAEEQEKFWLPVCSHCNNEIFTLPHDSMLAEQTRLWRAFDEGEYSVSELYREPDSSIKIVDSKKDIPKDYKFYNSCKNFMTEIGQFKNSYPEYRKTGGLFYILGNHGIGYGVYLKKSRRLGGNSINDTLWNSVSGY